ncbi:MAG: hypothetical protein KF767_00735 [Bdellovibrionaceae bacterium]|nr:hypothetical protein [Pseudobdellovibrionaceae bacterium]
MSTWMTAFPFMLFLSLGALAQLPDISPVSDATLPPTSERFELGRDTTPDANSARSLQEARRAWDIPWWSPAPTPSIYPMSRAPLGESENSTSPRISR